MEIQFLGTGSAWSVPEHSCRCAICAEMTRLGEERTRTCFLVRGGETILVDCGPDIRRQMRRGRVARPDAVLITHEHGDHFLGLDDLLAFRRSVPKEEWNPIPVYATGQAWEAVEIRFGYLLGSLLERREAVPGVPLEGLETKITPFTTFHGPTAAGSVGFVLEEPAGEGPFKSLFEILDDDQKEQVKAILEKNRAEFKGADSEAERRGIRDLLKTEVGSVLTTDEQRQELDEALDKMEKYGPPNGGKRFGKP